MPNAFNRRQQNSMQQMAMEQNAAGASVQNNGEVQEAVQELTSALEQAGAPSEVQQAVRPSVKEVAESQQSS